MVVRSNIFDPIHDELCPEIWDGSDLKSGVKEFILDKLQTWADTAGIGNAIIEVTILGGIAGHQYNSTSDIDVNVVVSLSQADIDEVKGSLPNGEDVPGTEHPVNFYLAPKFLDIWLKEANGVYDLLLDQWIKKPDKEDAKTPVQDYEAVIQIARFFISGLDATLSEYDRDVDEYEVLSMFREELAEDKDLTLIMNLCIQNIIADIDGLRVARHIIKALRGEAFLGMPMQTVTDIAGTGANQSINNLVYKYIEKLGYFDKVQTVLNEKDKWESILKEGTL